MGGAIEQWLVRRALNPQIGVRFPVALPIFYFKVKNMNRFEDWLNQSERDLKFAKETLNKGFFEWTCFICQQSAEKAVKALYYKFNFEPWGHSISKLLEEIKNEVKLDDEIINLAKYLDKFYIPTRYPNGFSEGYPGVYYTEEEAKRAIDACEKIISFIKKFL